MRSPLLFALLLTACTSPSSITGTVTVQALPPLDSPTWVDSTIDTLDEIDLTLYDEGGQAAVTETVLQGAFEIPNVDPGMYTLLLVAGHDEVLGVDPQGSLTLPAFEVGAEPMDLGTLTLQWQQEY